jgi:sporulation protein YlmC with PRC-barrel domain
MKRLQHPFIRTAMLALIAAGLSETAAAQGGSTGGSASAPTASAPAASSKQQSTGKIYRAARASEVIGMSVRNEKGDNIGQIDDLIVNMKTGDVRYAMLRFDPGILSGEKLFAVPTTELRMATDRDDLVYKMSRERLERAAVERKDWTDTWLDDPDRLARLDKNWGVKPPSSGELAHRASDLIGKDVESRAGDRIGKVEELVIDMAKQKVHYAVLEFDPTWAAPEKNFAFPLRAFKLTPSQGDDELVLDVDRAKVQSMKSFTDDRYANLNDTAWVLDVDRYLVTVTPMVAGGQGSDTQKAATPGGRAGESSAEMFTRLDDDKNGWLDKTEAMDSAEVDKKWSRLDKDNDGRITNGEFTSNYTAGAKR